MRFNNNNISEYIPTLVELREKIHKTHLIAHRSESIIKAAAAMSPEEKELLAFCCWHCLYNERIRKIDESRYFSVPLATIQQVGFQDFLTVLRGYQHKKITYATESSLVRFLGACDQNHRDFYLLLLTKTFTEKMPPSTLIEALSLDDIQADDVYVVEADKTSFSGLIYPIAFTVIPKTHNRGRGNTTTLELVGRETGISLFTYGLLGEDHQGAKLNRLGKLTNKGLQSVITQEFFLGGFMRGKNKYFVPIDYFQNKEAYLTYCTGKGKGEVLPYQERIAKLNRWLQNNYQEKIRPGIVGYADREEGVALRMAAVMSPETEGQLLVADNNTMKTGMYHVLPITRVQGVLEGVWVDKGSPVGFFVWFNGFRIPVYYKFAGVENALLANPKLVKGKVVEFWHIKLGNYRAGVVIQILHDKKPFRCQPSKGSDILIDKCVLCGTRTYRHECGGLCRWCDMNLAKMYIKRGRIDRWLDPTKAFKERRKATAWEPDLLMKVSPKFRGYRIKGNGKGQFMFATDPVAYHEWLTYKANSQTALDNPAVDRNEKGFKKRKRKLNKKKRKYKLPE